MGRVRTGVFAVLAAFMISACARSDLPGERLRETTSPLSSQILEVLGFEDLVWWTGASERSPQHTEGSWSLVVSSNGSAEVVSYPLSTLGPVCSKARLDIQLPAPIQYYGSVRLIMELPSQGEYWADLGTVLLMGLSAGQFHTLEFSIPPHLAASLAADYTDLRFRIAINAPAGDYLLDRLWLWDETTPPPTSPGPPAPTPTTFTIEYPNVTELGDVALLAQDGLSVHDEVVLHQDGGGYASVANVGTGTAQIGVHAHVGNVWSAEHTFLRSLCYVHGHVWTNSVETQGFFWEEDSVTDNFAMSANRTLSWSVAFEPLSPSIEREPWHAPFAALPGQYDKVTLKGGSALQLFSGTYYIRRLSTEPGSTLTLPPVGPIVLYVRDELSLKGTLSSDGSARDVLWVTADAGWVHVESPLFGTLIAPSANVVLAPQMTHRGMVIGKTIALHQRSHFYFEPFSNLRTVFVDMATRCQQCMTTCTQEDQRRLSDYNWRLISDCMDYAGSDSECRTSCYYSHFSDPNSRYQACASACSDYCL